MDKVLAEMVILVLLPPTVTSEQYKVNIVGMSIDGKLGEFLPCSLEPNLIGGQFI